MNEKEITFQVRRAFAQLSLGKGLKINSDRVQVKLFEESGEIVAKALFGYVTQEFGDYKHPLDWWQYFKQRWMPKWLLRKFPVRYAQVFEVHKYPEVALPVEFLGREFVHFKVVDEEELGIE